MTARTWRVALLCGLAAAGCRASFAAGLPIDGCAALMAEFDLARQSAPSVCRRDADCACYPDLRIDGLLAVSDRASAATLTVLSNRYREQHCQTIFRSTAGPPACVPRCSDQRCQAR